MNKRIVLENLRSAYNVGNIIRTADALWRWVVRVGYTARRDHKQVKKTSLWAEESIPKREFETIDEFLAFVTANNAKQPTSLVVAELTEKSIPLTEYQHSHSKWDFFLVVGNEVTGVEPQTLVQADEIVHIPMLGIKESLNVGQAAAIMMWEIQKHTPIS